MRAHILISSALGAMLASPAARAQRPQPEAFRVRHATLELSIDYPLEKLAGSMTYDLENWTAQPAREVSFLLNRLMDASNVRDGKGTPVPYTQDVRRVHDDPKWQVTQVIVKLPRPVAPGARTTLRIDYGGSLVGYTEIGWLYVHDHIDTAFTIIRSDALAFPIVGGLVRAANRTVPSVDFTYDASVRVPSKLLVATGGELARTAHDDGTTTWRYRSVGASPFLNIAIAPFDTISESGVHLFYFPADSAGARRLMQSAQNALRMLSQWFGPLHAPLDLTITEIPDGWGSQANLVGGIIQTAAAFHDQRHMRELYHELTHLWNAQDTDNPSPRWNEGLASFLEDLLPERLDGWTGRPTSDAWVLNTLKDAITSDSAVRTVPFIDYGVHMMTDRSYVVGNAMFEVLYESIGEEEFNKIIGGYYQKFANGGTTREFISFARQTSRLDLSVFFDDWMFTTGWTALVAKASSMSDLAEHYRATTPRKE
jgi:peptidase M1-like protein